VKPLDLIELATTLKSNGITLIDRRQAEQLSGTTPMILENCHVCSLFKRAMLLRQENRVSQETRPHGAHSRQEVVS
jgi:hypothetical protein